MVSVETALSTAFVETTLITGGGAGIGLEMARLLAARRHRLVLASRDADRLQVVAEQLRRTYGVEVHVHSLDLSKPGAALRLFDATEGAGLRVDNLINNAGFGVVEEHVAMAPDVLHRMLQLDVVAVAELSLHFGRTMKQRSAGRILNVASTAAFQPTPYFAAYGAAKSFVLNFSEALAKELEDHGVRVCCLAPGPTDTAFFDGVDPQRIAGDHHFGKAARARPVDVASAGVDLLLGGGALRVVGWTNRLMVMSNRFVPRALVAMVSKRLLRPLEVRGRAARSTSSPAPHRS
jgi:short-subunit dehydrogenase